MQYGRYIRADDPARPRHLDRAPAAGHHEFLERFPATVELAITALIFAIGVGIPLGYLAARRRAGSLDHAVGRRLAARRLIPVFVLAYMLKSSSR